MPNDSVVSFFLAEAEKMKPLSEVAPPIDKERLDRILERSKAAALSYASLVKR